MPLILDAYTGLAGAAAPMLRLWLRRRAARGKEIAARLPEREGLDATPRPAGKLIWLHAASMGETASILPVLAALAGSSAATLLLTTGTVTSAQLAAERLPAIAPGRALHRFVPLDVPAWAARFLDHWRPDAAGFVESEIWPSLLRACRHRGIPLALLNARLSARSFARWRRAPGLAASLFGLFDQVAAQSDADAARLSALGARDVTSPGNLKFAAPALPADAAELARLRALLGDRPVWLAASTHPGEEAIVARVHAALAPRHPGLLTIIVPRHAPRGAELAAQLAAPRRSQGAGPPAGAGLWLADTMSELGLFYRLAACAFVGGSLVGHGGQNPLEPARLGCPAAAGPYTRNFADPVAELVAAGALTEVADEAALTAWAARMLADPAARRVAGEAGQRAASRGADLPGKLAATLLRLAGIAP